MKKCYKIADPAISPELFEGGEIHWRGILQSVAHPSSDQELKD